MRGEDRAGERGQEHRGSAGGGGTLGWHETLDSGQAREMVSGGWVEEADGGIEESPKSI